MAWPGLGKPLPPQKPRNPIRKPTPSIPPPPPEDDFRDLLVFGYSAKIFKPEEIRGAAAIGRGEHLIAWNGDESLKIDRKDAGTAITLIKQALSVGLTELWLVIDKLRVIKKYDCRLHLTELISYEASNAQSSSGGILKRNLKNRLLSEEERVEEELCDEERYHDLKIALDEAEQEEEQKRSAGRGAEFQFNYDENGSSSTEKKEEGGTGENEDEYEDEPYIPRPELKVPTGMDIPETVRMNAIIEKTAQFVAKEGPQMEIIIKAKQKNSNRLDFMNWDDKLNTYYRHVLKMIKDRGYVPEPVEERLKKKEPEPESEEDSDEDGDYLHPLLTSGLGNSKSSESNTPRDTGTPNLPQVNYKLGEENDVYSALFHKLSAVMPKKEEPLPAVEAAYNEFENAAAAADSEDLAAAEEYESHGPPPSDYADWYQWFYGFAPANPQQGQVIPPPPDMMPVVNKSAEFVFRFGPTAETHLRQRRDLQLDFLQMGHQYHAYYETKIRWLQYEAFMEASKAALNQAETASNSTTGTNDDAASTSETPPPPNAPDGQTSTGNRASRRKQMFSNVPPPPSSDPEQPETADAGDQTEKRAGPISFQIKKGEEGSKLAAQGLDGQPMQPDEDCDGASPSTSTAENGEPVKRRRRGFARIGSAPVFGSNTPGQAIPPPGLVKIEGQPDGGKDKIQILPLPSTIVGQVLPEEPTPSLFRVGSRSPRSRSREPPVIGPLPRRRTRSPSRSSSKKKKRSRVEEKQKDAQLPSTAVPEESDEDIPSEASKSELTVHITESLERIDEDIAKPAEPAESEEAKAKRDARRKRAQMFLNKIKGKQEPELPQSIVGPTLPDNQGEQLTDDKSELPTQDDTVADAVEEGEIADANEEEKTPMVELEEGEAGPDHDELTADSPGVSTKSQIEDASDADSEKEVDSKKTPAELPTSYARTRRVRSSRSRSRERSKRHKDSDRKRRKHKRSRSRSSDRRKSSKKHRRRSRSRS